MKFEVNLKNAKGKESIRIAKLIREKNPKLSFPKAMSKAWTLIKSAHKVATAPSTLAKAWLEINFVNFDSNSAQAKRSFETEMKTKISRSQFFFIWKTFKETK